MQTTYGERLRKAREQAQLSQAGLARRVGIRPQAIQYLEDSEKAARGSQHTPAIAQACGVDPVWLASGSGDMLGKGAREPSARYDVHSARDLAKTIAALPPELRRAVGIIVDSLSTAGPRAFALGAAELAVSRPNRQTRKGRAAA